MPRKPASVADCAARWPVGSAWLRMDQRPERRVRVVVRWIERDGAPCVLYRHLRGACTEVRRGSWRHWVRSAQRVGDEDPWPG